VLEVDVNVNMFAADRRYSLASADLYQGANSFMNRQELLPLALRTWHRLRRTTGGCRGLHQQNETGTLHEWR